MEARKMTIKIQQIENLDQITSTTQKSLLLVQQVFNENDPAEALTVLCGAAAAGMEVLAEDKKMFEHLREGLIEVLRGYPYPALKKIDVGELQ